MKILFSKYHGTGNNFIMIDNRELEFPGDNRELINFLCNRNLGIGADGLILLEPHPDLDFRMRYFNSDGREATMCGNGGRCIIQFAKDNALINEKTQFEASDGLHKGFITHGLVTISLNPVRDIMNIKPHVYLLDTGSPHLVIFSDNIENMDMIGEGRKYRYDKSISEKGCNVNFAKIDSNNTIHIRTYERGVENETLSCGTGSVATAIAACTETAGLPGFHKYHLLVRGGDLEISFKKCEDGHFEDIYLKGPAVKVFSGELNY